MMIGQTILILAVAFLLLRSSESFSFPSFNPARSWRYGSYLQQQSSGDEDSLTPWDQGISSLKRIQEQKIRSAIVEQLFLSEESTSEMMSISVIGKAKLSLGNQTSTTAIVVALAPTVSSTQNSALPTEQDAILVPLTSPESQLKLLSFAIAQQPLPSLTLLLSLNTLLVNRDNALFDNLPWSGWSVDPQRRNRDAAGNPIANKFHFGKRDAYNRFMGKDWPGRSLALGNLAMRLQHMLDKKSEGQPSDSGKDGDGDPSMDSSNGEAILTRRILQLRIRELQMELAEIASQSAIARNNRSDFSGVELQDLQSTASDLEKDLAKSQEDLILLSGTNMDSTKNGRSQFTENIAQWAAESESTNLPPYRGAMGYSPKVDSIKEMEQTFLDRSYRSPFDLVLEILDDQLNARIIGAVLEDTSLLKGNIVLGGAIVIQRKVPKKTTRLAGEEVQYEDAEETFGNEGIMGGEILVVECDMDEAIGVSLASDIPLQMERSLFEQTTTVVEMLNGATEDDDDAAAAGSWRGTLPLCRPKDPSMFVQVEGDTVSPEKEAPISIPRTTSALFDSTTRKGQSSDDGSPQQLFPTDNPIKSLKQLDELDNAAKAKTLLEMSNFRGSLPRPRVVRNAPNNKNPLDQLLLPLIDESVRRQYQLREAKQSGNRELVAELETTKSELQEARERVVNARLEGDEITAQRWEEEARFLETLRADVTQDVGAYSRFLDRDEWYERDRLKTAQRAKKSSFGNLLDGIE